MKHFCKKCGKTTLYKVNIPDKCAYCNSAFASNIPITNTYIKNELNLNKNINEVEEDEEEVALINFKNIKPKFNVVVYNSTPQKFGDLFQNNDEPNKEVNNFSEQNISINNTNRVENQNLKSAEQIMAEFQSEASSSRNKN